MKVYRIEREKYLLQTLSGIGASLHSSSRWNSEGTRIVYTSQSRSLAMLEALVHLDSSDLPSDRFVVEIIIPDNVRISTLSKKTLPKNWYQNPADKSSQLIGDSFIISSTAAVLKVPSAIVPEEFNYLINPMHPDAKRIKISRKTKLAFDPRL